MQRKFSILATSTLAAFSIYQIGSEDYKDLPIPQTGLLGRQLQALDLKKGIIQPMPVPKAPNFTYEVFEGPNSVSDYKSKLRKLVVPAFNKNKLKVSDIKINALKIKALAPENFTNGNLPIGASFAYDGITADTVKITFRTAKDYAIKPSEIVDIVSKFIPGGTVFTTITDVVKNVKISGKDSTQRVIRIVNPNVFFKARFITYTETSTRSGSPWENWSISFNPATGNMNGKTDLVNLTIEGEDTNSRTHGYYPEFSGGGSNDLKSQKYFFKVSGTEGNLKLIFALDQPNNDNSDEGYRVIKEIPFKTIKGMREYSLGYRTVDRFTYHDITKLVRIAVFAKQISPTTIQLINYNGNRRVTYMKYPEFKIKYIDKI
jgi:hypothetical protein